MTHFINYVLRILYVAVFGYILVTEPENIIDKLPRLLGGLLLIETFAQLIEILLIKKRANIHKGFVFVPLFVLIFAIILLCIGTLGFEGSKSVDQNFKEHGEAWFEIYMSGFCFIALIISELILTMKYFKPLHRPDKWKEEKMKKEAYTSDSLQLEGSKDKAMLNEGK